MVRCDPQSLRRLSQRLCLLLREKACHEAEAEVHAMLPVHPPSQPREAGAAEPRAEAQEDLHRLDVGLGTATG